MKIIITTTLFDFEWESNRCRKVLWGFLRRFCLVAVIAALLGLFFSILIGCSTPAPKPVTSAPQMLMPPTIPVSRKASVSPVLTLEWDPSTDPSITGYLVYQGQQSLTYTNVIGTTNTSLRLDWLPPGTNYLAAKAVNSDGLESDFSDEVSCFVSAPPQHIVTLSIESSTDLITWQQDTNFPIVTVTNLSSHSLFWRLNLKQQ